MQATNSFTEPRGPSSVHAMFKRIIAALGFVVGLASCTTPPVVTAPPIVTTPPVVMAPPPASVPRMDLDGKIVAANAVYFARVERSGGLVHYIVTEIWRHDPALGTAPAVGSEWVTMFPKNESAERGDAVVIFVGPSQPLDRHSAHAGSTEQMASVANGHLVASHTSVAELHARVAAGTAPARLTPSSAPTLDEVVSRASAIYLARIERSGGLLHYIVAEIWRSDPKQSPPPAIGTEVLASRPKKDIPTMNYGDFVVVSIFSPPLKRPDGKDIPEGAASVLGGNVIAFHRSLTELRALLTSSKLPADP